MFATNSFFHAIGTIFHPILQAFGWLLAFFYGLIPNYAVAISLLTIVIMGALTPFTVKSTKSMMSMQRLQPEIKKLQQKYKGAENRQTLNEEMMKLYKEEGANPLGGCLPLLLQAPFLSMLYFVIKGLSNRLADKKGHLILHNGHFVSLPKYIPTNSKMYHDLVSHFGAIKTFGLDLSLKAIGSGISIATRIPLIILVAIAVGLQYFQMSQMNTRNKKTGQAIPNQQQMIQRFMPLFFTYFYLVIPAAVVVYMVVSTTIRIVTQDIMFRTGVSNPQIQRERKLQARASQGLPVELEATPETTPTSGLNSTKGQKSEPKPLSHPRAKAKRKRKDR